MNFNDSSSLSHSNHHSGRLTLAQHFKKQDAKYYQNPNSKLLLFSCDTLLGNQVRSALHPYSAEYFDLSILADGGDLMLEDYSELQKVLDIALNEDKIIVLLGVDPKVIYKLQKRLVEIFHPHSFSFISDRWTTSEGLDLNTIYLKELNVIGYQRQHPLCPHPAINVFRLGEYRNNPSCIEPAIRRSEIVHFNLNAIRSSDNPGSEIKNPSGFYAEEASAIARMAGMSERLKIFSISRWNENKDIDKVTANLVAQMIWYFWEGCHLKKLDEHVNKESLTQYSVEIKNLDYIIRFYKSEKSGKWWFEEPLIDNEFSNQLIPCSYDEYVATVNDQIPGRILEMING